MSVFTYNIFGLNFASPMEIPGARIATSNNIDVFIRYGESPDHLEKTSNSGVLFESSENEFLLKLPKVGKYYVENGNCITIEPGPEARESEIRLFLLGSVLGAILYQRGYTPLHGSAVSTSDGEALIIIGNSASGKSTLAASLSKSGFPLISDDQSAILPDNNGNCIILPGIATVKLWMDAKTQLFPVGDYSRVRPELNKFNIPVSGVESDNKAYLITRIINLVTKNSEGITSETVSGARKLSILRAHVFREQLIKGMGLLEDHFHLLSTLARQAKIYQIARPSLPQDSDILRDYIIDRIIRP